MILFAYKIASKLIHIKIILYIELSLLKLLQICHVKYNERSCYEQMHTYILQTIQFIALHNFNERSRLEIQYQTNKTDTTNNIISVVDNALYDFSYPRTITMLTHVLRFLY